MLEGNVFEDNLARLLWLAVEIVGPPSVSRFNKFHFLTLLILADTLSVNHQNI